MAEALALGIDLWTLNGMAPTGFGAIFTGSRLWSVTVIAADANELVSSVAVTCNPHFASP